MFRLERVLALPPFWLSFAFVALVGLPQAFLALPIVAAPVGPLPAIALVGLLLLFNLATMTAITEALVRLPAAERPANLDGLARLYLGPAAGRMATVGVALISIAASLAGALAFALALAGLSGLPRLPLLALLALAVVVITNRGTVSHSISIVLGAGAVLLLGLIMILLVPHFDPARLGQAHLPDLAAAGADAALWSPLVGVALLVFFGQLLLPAAARLALPRDPGGRGFIAGAAAGTLFLGVFMAAWLLLVDDTVFAGQLIGLHGTVLVTLGRDTGPAVTLAGAVLVLVLPGLGTIRCSTVLMSQTRTLLAALGDGPVSRVLPSLPVLATFGLAALLLDSGGADVSAVMGIAGVLGVSVATALLPLPLLAAARRRYPGVTTGTPSWLVARPLLLAGNSLLGLVVLAYGTLVWQEPLERAAALGVALLIGPWLTILGLRARSWEPRPG